MEIDAKIESTKQFFELTPERVLTAVETYGFRCTGRCLALNSMENRVYEVEIEIEDDAVRTPADRFKVIKFYRPGRWSKQQIQEEHDFINDLARAELAVVPPLEQKSGSIILQEDTGIFYSVFPKMGGRNPDELNDDQLEQIGRLIGRMHAIGAAKTAAVRIKLNGETYGRENLEYLLSSNTVPTDIRDAYTKIVSSICDICADWFSDVALQRIHGDLHFGNLLWRSDGPLLVDFDDMVQGPCVQDIWLLTPGRGPETDIQRSILLEGYEQMNRFNRDTLRLIEPLRALRMIHFTAWIARRWEDPSFKRVFVNFGSQQYWRDQLADLNEQLMIMHGAA